MRPSTFFATIGLFVATAAQGSLVPIAEEGPGMFDCSGSPAVAALALQSCSLAGSDEAFIAAQILIYQLGDAAVRFAAARAAQLAAENAAEAELWRRIAAAAAELAANRQGEVLP
jgi:hypothetical protein